MVAKTAMALWSAALVATAAAALYPDRNEQFMPKPRSLAVDYSRMFPLTDGTRFAVACPKPAETAAGAKFVRDHAANWLGCRPNVAEVHARDAEYAPRPVDGQLECRVRQTAGGPRIFVDGKVVPPRFFYGDDGMGPLDLSADWKSYEASFRPDGDVAKGTLHFRFPHETGWVEIRSLKVTASDGSDVDQTWQCYPAKGKHGFLEGGFSTAEDGSVSFRAGFVAPGETNARKEEDFHVYLKQQPLKAGVDYRVSFEARSGGGIVRTRVMAYEFVDGWRSLNIPASDGGSLVRQAKMAAAVGVDFVTFHVRFLWPDDGCEEDFSSLDRTCRDLIRANPNVRLVPRIRLEGSFAWFEKHPELRETYGDGRQAKVCGCIADPDYRALMKRHAVRVCRHMMQSYPRNFAGIHICALSEGGEWFYMSAWSRLSGYDLATRNAFRRYLADCGVDGAEEASVPTVDERKKSVGIWGSRLLDPVKSRRLLQFNRFRQNLVADTLAEMAAACRAATDEKKLVLAFYGYTFEFGMNWSGPANTGNYAVGRLLQKAAGDIDILCGPGSYFDRHWAQGGPVMSAAETIERVGVLWLNEDDSTTFTDFGHADRPEGCKMTLEQNREMLRRNETKAGMAGYGSWWMDLFGAGWYQDERLWDVRRELTPFAERMCRRTRPFSPDVAAIVDEDSMLFGIWGFDHPIVSRTRAGLARMGAPYGQYLLSDIMENPIAAKLKIFLAAWYLPEERRIALRRMMDEDGGVKVWCWAPGWLTDKGADVVGIEATTGFKVRRVEDGSSVVHATKEGLEAGLCATIGKGVVRPLFAVAELKEGDMVWARYRDGSPAIVVRRRGRGTDVFEGLPASLPAEFLAACARMAGVHLYVKPNTATVWSADDDLAVQAFEDSDFAVRWPDGATRSLSLRKGECRLLSKDDEPSFPRGGPLNLCSDRP